MSALERAEEALLAELARLTTENAALRDDLGRTMRACSEALSENEALRTEALIVPWEVALRLYQGPQIGNANYEAAKLDFGRLVRTSIKAREPELVATIKETS